MNVPRIFAVVLFASLASCVRAAPVSPPSRVAAPCMQPVRVALQASEQLNLSEHGDALPTSVRVYQLRRAERMETSDFAAVWQAPDHALAGDLLAVRSFTLFPGKTESAAVELVPDARFLSSVAIFRQPNGTQWRTIVPLPRSFNPCSHEDAPSVHGPAITFHFKQYSVEARSRLSFEPGARALPADVAPSQAAPSHAALVRGAP